MLLLVLVEGWIAVDDEVVSGEEEPFSSLRSNVSRELSNEPYAALLYATSNGFEYFRRADPRPARLPGDEFRPALFDFSRLSGCSRNVVTG